MSGAPLVPVPAYADFGHLTELGARARARDPEALRSAARQVEALFLNTLLKSMREASFGDPLLGGDQGRFYRDLFDSQISQHLSARSGLGLADALVRELRGGTSEEPSAELRMPPPDGNRAAPSVPRTDPGAVSALPTDHAGFVAQLLPHARQAAQRLGVDPRLLVAQAALETGWGRAVMHTPTGASSHNLFGIKAGADWDGARVLKTTLEFRDGAMVREWAPFKVYDSLAQGFDDYARLVAESPRYAPARAAASEPRSYIDALAGAGYATDPDYGAKVIGVFERLQGIQAGRGI